MCESASQVRAELQEEICNKCRKQILEDFAGAEDIDYVLNYFCHNCTPDSYTVIEKLLQRLKASAKRHA